MNDMCWIQISKPAIFCSLYPWYNRHGHCDLKTAQHSPNWTLRSGDLYKSPIGQGAKNFSEFLVLNLLRRHFFSELIEGLKSLFPSIICKKVCMTYTPLEENYPDKEIF